MPLLLELKLMTSELLSFINSKICIFHLFNIVTFFRNSYKSALSYDSEFWCLFIFCVKFGQVRSSTILIKPIILGKGLPLINLMEWTNTHWSLYSYIGERQNTAKRHKQKSQVIVTIMVMQGGRTWQAFGGGKNGHETFRQARIYNFCDKCVVFAHNLKFSNLTQ